MHSLCGLVVQTGEKGSRFFGFLQNVARLGNTGLNNDVLPTIFTVVNNAVDHY